MSCKKQKTKLIYVIWHIIIAFYKAWNFVALLQKYRKNMDKRPRINVLSVLEVEKLTFLRKYGCQNYGAKIDKIHAIKSFTHQIKSKQLLYFDE